jgi:NAD+ synthase
VYIRLVTEIVSWLRQRAIGANARGFVVGLSGGIDSAVVARLCQLAIPDQVLAVVLPCGGNPRDEADAQLVADAFGLTTARIDLEPACDELLAEAQDALAALPPHMRQPSTGPDDRVALGNIQPRLRMSALYFLANSLGYLVAGTGNRSELTLGYFTKHGDGGVDVLPIGHLLKSQVRSLAHELGVPQPILDKAPSAGLWPGQTDEEEMGFSYDDLERYLTHGPEGVSPALALRLERTIRATEHKRSAAPTPDER